MMKINFLSITIIVGGIDSNKATVVFTAELVPCSSGECIFYSCTEQEYRYKDTKCIANIFVCNCKNARTAATKRDAFESRASAMTIPASVLDTSALTEMPRPDAIARSATASTKVKLVIW